MPNILAMRRVLVAPPRSVVAGPAAGFTATDNPSPLDDTQTSATFNNVAIGTPDPSRIVHVVWSSEGSVASTMTIGGVSATKAEEESSAISGLQIWYASVPTGTTATIAITSGGGMNNEVPLVGVSYGMTFGPTDTAKSATGATDPASETGVIIPAGGFAVVGMYSDVTGKTATPSWTNATQDFKTATNSGGSLWMAHHAVAGTHTVSASGLGGGQVHMIAASWGP